ncbi:hypothetical protein [Candidatus Alkanophaga liquidiphilum]
MPRENIVKENSRLAGKLGGSKTSERKRLAVTLNARRRCAPSCSIYPCPFQPLAEGGECALKRFSDELRRRITHSTPATRMASSRSSAPPQRRTQSSCTATSVRSWTSSECLCGPPQARVAP